MSKCKDMEGKGHPKTDLYMAERESGMSYREIAKKHGVSYQAVAQACRRVCPKNFRTFTEGDVIYPNLRKWLNDNTVSRREFAARLGMVPCGSNTRRVSKWFRGETNPQKVNIDKFILVTGLSYEKLFEEDAT